MNCHEIAPHVPWELAVLAEPTACVVHALDLADPVHGARVLVYGAGIIGTLAAQIAARLGAESVTIVELNPERRDAATRRGITTAPTPDGDGREWDLVVDATGAAPAIEDGLSRLARGGTFLQIGVADPATRVALSPFLVFQRELRIRGSLTTRHSFPRAIAMLESGTLDLAGAVGVWGLSEYSAALERARGGSVLKVAVDPAR